VQTDTKILKESRLALTPRKGRNALDCRASTLLLLICLTAPHARAGAIFKTVAYFNGTVGADVSAQPNGALVQGPEGSLYGTAYNGGPPTTALYSG